MPDPAGRIVGDSGGVDHALDIAMPMSEVLSWGSSSPTANSFSSSMHNSSGFEVDEFDEDDNSSVIAPRGSLTLEPIVFKDKTLAHLLFKYKLSQGLNNVDEIKGKD